MKRIVVIFLAVALIIGAVGPAVMAQETPEDIRRQEKDPIIGAGLAAVIPSAGHYYAEDWGRALRPVGVMGAGIGMQIASGFFWRSPGIATALFTAGSLASFGGWVWNIADAYWAVEDYNQELRSFQPFIIPDLAAEENSIEMGVNYSF